MHIEDLVGENLGGAAEDPLLGKTIDGRYRLIERIANGGSGVVYRAEHLRIGGMVAIKLVNPTAHTAAALAQLESEARSVTLIGHDNIVTVFDFGRFEDAAYLAMELLAGETLESRIRRQRQLSLDSVCTILIQVAFALDAAHRCGVVHRDVKPANIFLCSDERGRSDVVKVLDFGLASLPAPMEGQEKLAGTVAISGTPPYLAPESLHAGTPDHHADLFALGVTLYQSLSGHLPFDGRNPVETLRRISTLEPLALRKRVPDLPLADQVEALVAYALEKDPQRRIPSADHFRRALIELRKDLELPARRREELVRPPDKRGLASWVSNLGRIPALELAGVLEDGAELATVTERISSPRLTIRPAGITHVTSSGYEAWCSWLARTLARFERVELCDLPPALVRQANVDPAFLSRLAVTSVLAPYHCPRCTSRRLVSIKAAAARARVLPTPACEACDREMRFDEVEQTYFRFLAAR